MLVELQGSPKQISWAKRIRKDKLEQWKSSDPLVFARVESVLNNEASAAWWITYREKDLGEVLTYIQGGGTTKTSGNLGVSSASTRSSSSEKMTYVSSGDDGGITRYVGELRDAVTGEFVVDPECPF